MAAANISEAELIKYYCEPHEGLSIAWDRLIEGLKKFANKYPHVHILLSISKFGVLTLDRGSVIHAFYCGKVELNTTVGAGDSFLGGFVTSYVEHDPHNMETALLAGVTTAVARLQGQHREFGYIDQEIIQRVRTSEDLKVNKFKTTEAAQYVEKTLLPCFPTCQAQNQSPPNPSLEATAPIDAE
jgi:hypothetical protein